MIMRGGWYLSGKELDRTNSSEYQASCAEETEKGLQCHVSTCLMCKCIDLYYMDIGLI